MSKSFPQKYRNIVQRLAQVRKRQKLIDCITGSVWFVAGVLGLFFLAVVIEYSFQFQKSGRVIVDGGVLVLTVILLVKFIIIPLWLLLFRQKVPSLKIIALKVGEKFPTIKDRLSNAIQIYQSLTTEKNRYSKVMVLAALDTISKEVEAVYFTEVLNRSKLFKSFKWGGSSLVVMLFCVLIWQAPFSQASIRLLHPLGDYSILSEFEYRISPGNITVVKGESLELSAQILKKDGPDHGHLLLKKMSTQVSNELLLPREENNRYTYRIESISDSLEYVFQFNEQKTEAYNISVVALPMVRQLFVSVKSPLYSAIPTQHYNENDGNISGLAGSRVSIEVKSNKCLQSAGLVFSGKDTVALKVDSTEARGIFSLRKNDTYHITLQDTDGRFNENPIEYDIRLVPDQYPLIKILSPTGDLDITPDTRLILLGEAEDDFGFFSISLHAELFREKSSDSLKHIQIKIPLNRGVQEKMAIEYDWDLTQINMEPGDWIRYYLEVQDNDNVSGPKSATSLTYTLRYPSLDEMYEDLNEQSVQSEELLESVYDDGKELKREIDEALEEMRKDPQMTWDEQQEIQGILQKQEHLFSDLEKVEKELDQLIENVEKQQLLSSETLKKYEELQKLFQEMATPELKKHMQNLQQAMEDLNEDQILEAMEQLQMNEDNFLKTIERTAALLKKIQVEQKLDELIKKIDHMAEQQSDLSEQANENNVNQKDDLAEEQKKLAEQTSGLADDFSDLQDKMKELANASTDEVTAAEQVMSEENVSGKMNQAAGDFKQGRMQQGSMKGQKAEHALSQMSNMLQQTKSKMANAQKEKLMKAMRRSTHELLKLSHQQERLLQSTQQLRNNSPEFNDMAETQQDLQLGLARTAEDLLALAKETFFLSSDIGTAMGKAMQRMETATAATEQRQGARAVRMQGEAMAALNQAVNAMRNSMQQASASGSGSGMEQLMQQLQQASGQQKGLNAQTQGMMKGGGALSLAQQAGMARLAGQQRGLQKTLQELAREAGGRPEIMGDLNHLTDEMGEVADDLAQGGAIKPKTIHRQQRILSRLLDAQRSMRERDYSRKREADTAQKYTPRRIADLPRDLGEKKLKLQEDLLQALKENYARDYKDLIKKYFEALSQEMERQNETN